MLRTGKPIVMTDLFFVCVCGRLGDKERVKETGRAAEQDTVSTMCVVTAKHVAKINSTVFTNGVSVRFAKI